MKLTDGEKIVFNGIVDVLVPSMAPGKHFANDFFGINPVNPRIVRHLYEQVKAGKIKRLSLAGQRSKDGYIIS